MSGPKTSDKSILGWVMYDFANSAFATTVAVAILPAYFAAAVVPAGGYDILGQRLSATSLWGYTVSLSTTLVFLLAPLLGAIADFAARKKAFMTFFCYLGSLATMLLFLCGPGDVLPTLALFSLAQIGFISANVFYDAFLPQIVKPSELDRISARGFAYGYVGGGLQYALSLGLVSLAGTIGITQDLAARLAIGSAGLWWAGFALFTVAYLHEPARAATPAQGNASWLRLGLGELRDSFSAMRQNRDVLTFFLAYFFYNDGIQTVIAMATVYGKDELGLSMTSLMLTLLIIQVVAVPGALGFSRIAERTSTMAGLVVSLILWTGVVVYGYFIDSSLEFMILGLLVGLVIGGSQSLSRSLYASMIPPANSAQYFGLFSVINKFSAIKGPLLFAAISQATGSARLAILSLAAFFVVGLGLLCLVKAGRSKSSAA